MKQLLVYFSVFFFIISCAREKEAKYVLSPEKQEQLKAFRTKDKFSAEEWQKRGVEPSSQVTIQQMEGVVNGSVDRILQEQNNLTTYKIRTIVSAELDRLGIFDLNTEEKKFLAQVLMELSGILQVDLEAVVKDDLY